MSSLNDQKEIQFLKVNRYQVQQNAVFISYQPAQLTKKISCYTTLKFQQRLSLSKNILTIRSVLNQSKYIYQLLQLMSKDHQEIQKQILQQFKEIINLHSSQIKSKYPDFKQFLILPLINLIKGMYLQIKEDSCNLISKILTIYKGSQIYQQQITNVFNLAISLAHDQNQQNKIVSIQLLGKILPSLKQKDIQASFQNQYKRIYNQSTVRVKKQVIINLYVISQYVSQQFFEQKILTEFFLKCCKQSAWGIRKACVEQISKLIPQCKQNTKKQQLIHMLLHFLKDGNKIVRVSAHRVIPDVLAHYGSKNPPQKLFHFFLKLVDNQINQSVSSQNQIIIQIAYFFPGVLHTMGRQKWPQMKKLFQKLLKYKDDNVKMPIACSLHEIAKIIGPQASKQTIFQALDFILKQQSDKLKLNAIAHLSQFVQLFDKVTQQNLIDVFLVLQKDPKKWRIRHSIAHQLASLSSIYDPQVNFKYIIPIALKLCNDNVNQVRDEAANQIFGLIDNLKNQQSYQMMSIESIKGFGLSEKCIQRQTFAKMVKKMFEYDQIQKNYGLQLLQLIEKICNDSVVLVRITLAISIIEIIKKKKERIVIFDKAIKELIKDEQVKQYFEQIKEHLAQINVIIGQQQKMIDKDQNLKQNKALDQQNTIKQDINFIQKQKQQQIIENKQIKQKNQQINETIHNLGKVQQYQQPKIIAEQQINQKEQANQQQKEQQIKTDIIKKQQTQQLQKDQSQKQVPQIQSQQQINTLKEIEKQKQIQKKQEKSQQQFNDSLQT